MKWIPVNKPGTFLFEYQLTEGGNKLASLKFNPLQKSARIRAGERQQVFFVERSGFRNTRMMVENEYGVKIGIYTAEDAQSQSGDLLLHDTQYHFKLFRGPAQELVLYKEDMVSPLLSCSVSLQTEQTIASVECSCLLLGLCWHLSQLQPVNNAIQSIPVRKESKPTPAFVIN